MTRSLTPREKVAPSLNELLRQAVETMKSWTPEQREAHFEAQKKAWVAAEMAFGDEGTRVVTPPAAALASSGDHAELARLAKDASSGPWSVDADDIGRTIVASPVEIVARDTRHNSAFIAAANPAAVLALIAESAALRGACDRANEHWKKTQAAWSEVLVATGCKDGGELVDRANQATEAERKLAEAVADKDAAFERLDTEINQHGTTTERLAEAVGLLRRIDRTYADMQDGNGNHPTELRKVRTFLSKEAERG